jgi:hypothetical protein
MKTRYNNNHPVDAILPLAKKAPLTIAETLEFERLDSVIKGGWKTFLEIGAALVEVKKKDLFRDKYKTFEAYCREGLGFSRAYAYSLLNSAQVNAQVSAIADIQFRPANEAQFRELIPDPRRNNRQFVSAVCLAANAGTLKAEMSKQDKMESQGTCFNRLT